MIVGIVGPTGSGKTSLSIRVAKEIGGEIISCDSVQVYKGFNIGSGKVKYEEMEGIRHHLLDIRDGNDSFSVGDFVKLTQELVVDIEKRGKIPIIVGGTGLYYRAFAYRYELEDERMGEEDLLRKKYSDLMEEKGLPYLYALLTSVDPLGGENINPNHSSRIIRALIYFDIHGSSIINQNNSSKGLREDLLGIFLDVDRNLLYNNINSRVDEMIAEGLLEEVEGLINNGISKDSQPMKTIGYKEIVGYLEGRFSFDEAVEKIKQASRNYAKRQVTWFKRQKELFFMKYNKKDDEKEIIYFIKKNLIKID